MESEIKTRVITLISQWCELPPEEITSDLSLDEAGFDSLVLVEIAMKLRKEFGITASDDELLLVDTVGDLLNVMAVKHA